MALSRRQFLFRGALATGGLVFSGIVLRAASFLFEGPGRGRKSLSDREVAILEAMIPVLLPGGDGMPAGDTAFIVPWVDGFLKHSASDVRILFRSMLHVVENQSLLLHLGRFSKRTLEERTRDLRAYELAPQYLERKAFQSVKLVVGLAYFEQPGTLDAVGFFVGCAPDHLRHLSKERLSAHS